jgi:hypothetical protein
MLPPSCCHAAALQHWYRHHCRYAAAAPMLPHYCCHTAVTTRLLPPPRCCVRRRVTTKLPPLPLPPRCRHCCHHRQRCQATTAATKLLPLPLSTLQDKFDNEKEFCNMTDIDFVRLFQLFWLGVEFLHGGMLLIFDALVYLSLYCNNL